MQNKKFFSTPSVEQIQQTDMQIANGNKKSEFVTFAMNVPLKIRLLPTIPDLKETNYCDIYHSHFVELPNPEDSKKPIRHSIYCPGSDCPMCRVGYQILNQGKEMNDTGIKEIAKRFFANQQVIARCIVQGREDEAPLFIKLPSSVVEQVSLTTTAGISVLDVETGRWMTITKVKKNLNKGEHFTNVKYTCVVDQRPKPIDPDLLDSILEKLVSFKDLHKKAVKTKEEIKIITKEFYNSLFE